MQSICRSGSRSAGVIAALCMLFATMSIATAPDAQAWSDAEHRISYIATASDGIGQVFTMKPDGTGVRQITTGGVKKCDPAFSPDGTEIAYASSDGNFYVSSANGGSQTTIYHGVDSEGGRRPTWSRDGNTIVFHVTANWNNGATPNDQLRTNLWMVQRMDRDAPWQPPVQLTDLQGAAFYSRFSPDGARVLYTYRPLGTDAKGDLWVMPAPAPLSSTTTAPALATEPPGQRITTGANTAMASWAPSGNQIAYTAACGTGLFIMPITTSAGTITAGTPKLVVKGTCEATWSSHSETLLTYTSMGKVQRLDVSGARPKSTALRAGSQPGW